MSGKEENFNRKLSKPLLTTGTLRHNFYRVHNNVKKFVQKVLKLVFKERKIVTIPKADLNYSQNPLPLRFSSNFFIQNP